MTINTTKNSSRGLDATYNGTIIAKDVNITTNGTHCAALANDRGEGTVHLKQVEQLKQQEQTLQQFIQLEILQQKGNT